MLKIVVMYGTAEVTTLLCPVFKNRSSPDNCATFFMDGAYVFPCIRYDRMNMTLCK